MSRGTHELSQSSDSADLLDIPWNHPPLEFLSHEIINFFYLSLGYLLSKRVLTKTQPVLKMEREISGNTIMPAL